DFQRGGARQPSLPQDAENHLPSPDASRHQGAAGAGSATGSPNRGPLRHDLLPSPNTRMTPKRQLPCYRVDFPGHSWSARAESAAAKQPGGAPQMTKAACRTDRSSAESGGSHGRSSERCVVGSPYFLAERSAVGSQVAYGVSPGAGGAVARFPIPRLFP